MSHPPGGRGRLSWSCRWCTFSWAGSPPLHASWIPLSVIPLSNLKVWFQLRIELNRWEAPNVPQIWFHPSRDQLYTEKFLLTKSKDRWRRIQIFSIRTASLPLDGIKQNCIYKWPLNGCLHQIITACRFHKMRLITTSLENENIMK